MAPAATIGFRNPMTATAFARSPLDGLVSHQLAIEDLELWH